ncbi:FAD-dependent oxidoreductase [Singulisphaera acidiphila]|uniref:FAD-dependent oxidoreductase n=1 Tax=Singulisphaera acidiphila TaxID=466153 RepID=UPI00036BE259|nr:cyclic nucleotide-binding domain-containing thioredoxin-disulfide reductase [Singulisphaera acidiphila]
MAEQDLHHIAFPTLDEAQIAKLGRCTGASAQRFQDGQMLFRVGDRNFKFFVIKSGLVEILDESGETAKTLTVHRPGGFTGDVSHLTGNPAVVSAVARGDCEVYEIASEGLKQILSRCPDLSDIILQAFIARRQLLREPGNFTGLRVIGSRYSQDTFRIRDFLAQNRVLFTWLDLEANPQVNLLLQQFGVSESDTPVVACGRLLLLRNPSTRKLAETIGIRRTPEQVVYDLAVVGAGPAGLAAAVYGASEGLNTVILERAAPGGQAGRSMRIENYLGFPTGLTGSELTDRAVLQADKFGALLSVPTPVTGLTFDQAYAVLQLDGGGSVVAKCLLIASGADYRRLGVEGCERLEGGGVYYAATPNEAQLCRGADVMVVGGGNSAGQAVVYLAGQARKVFLLIRGDNLYKNMSSYLARRIEQTDNVEVLCNTEVRQMHGDSHLTTVEVENTKTGEAKTLETPALFSFIGAVPWTDWLPNAIATDSRGFVRTGPSLKQSPSWVAPRDPFLLETSRPGVFAAGDVRSGSVKRVASAVGEGAMVVQFVHEYLKDL